MSVCASCSTENPDGAKFCSQCGTPFGLQCPHCGSTGQPGGRFCIECGTALGAPALPEAVPVSGEKKQITVLFADVAGSMDLQEQLDGEVWAEIMGRFVSILAEGVRKFGGTVDKFTGDGIMALFGAPVAQEDHARRACHAAWHLTKAIGEYSEELRREYAIDLQVRLGLNSGEVVVGQVGDDVTLDATALGHTVGLAQRMEAMAEPGSALLTEHAARLVEGWFELEDLGSRPVKGARNALKVYALGPPSGSPPVLHGGALGIVPLVGRDRELAALEEALGAAEEGRAQVVGVVGEAGVGKSRLCDEFAAWASARGITVRRAAGLSHARDVPLTPILAYLRDYFGITTTDGPEEARRRIAARLLDLDPGFDADLPLVFDLLEVADPDRPAPRLAPEARRRKLFDIIRRVGAKRSERETLILNFEDLHWFDPHSAEFLERLIESFPGSRTLVITNFRPEFSASWMRHSYYRQLALNPLGEQAVGDLVRSLVGSDSTVEEVRAFILDRTGGNPFFIEELVRSLVEDGTLTGTAGDYRLVRPLHEIAVPPSVQAVLAARIDRLPLEEKAVLQAAAVIGRTFTLAVLAATAGRPSSELTDSLDALLGAELLQEVTTADVRVYRFWHPLTQEVTYRSLLGEHRRHLHGAVARAIIDLESHRLDELAALIATHFDAAEDRLEAARWHDRAAQWALRHDLGEAVRRWKAVATATDALPPSTEALRLGAWVRSRLLRFQLRTGLDASEAERLFTTGRAMAEQIGDVALVSAVSFAYGTVSIWHGHLQDGFQHYSDAASLAEEIKDAGLKASLSTGPPIVAAWTGPVAEGLAWVDRVLALCAGDADLGAAHLGFSPITRSLYSQAELYAVGGRLDLARSAADEALALARQRSEVEQACWALGVYALVAEEPTQFQEAVDHGQEGVQLADQIGNMSVRTLVLISLGIAEVGGGRVKEGIATLERVLGEMRQFQLVRFRESVVLAHLAIGRLLSGDREAALRTAEDAVSVARQQGARVLESFAVLTRATVRRRSGGADDQVRADLLAALGLVRETGALTYAPFIHEELSRLSGDVAELQEALRLYRQIGASGHAGRLEAELSRATR